MAEHLTLQQQDNLIADVIDGQWRFRSIGLLVADDAKNLSNELLPLSSTLDAAAPGLAHRHSQSRPLIALGASAADPASTPMRMQADTVRLPACIAIGAIRISIARICASSTGAHSNLGKPI